MPNSGVRSPKSVRNSSYATTRRRRSERARGAPLCAPYTASHIFSPNRPLCENTEQKPAPVKCNAHKAKFLRGLKQCSTLAHNLQCCRPPSPPGFGLYGENSHSGFRLEKHLGRCCFCYCCCCFCSSLTLSARTFKQCAKPPPPPTTTPECREI